MKKVRACKLCSEEASLYCALYSAFLCFRYDAKVHQANFLVARHVRQALCFKCEAFLIIRSPVPGMIVSNSITAWLAHWRMSLVPITILLLLLRIAFRAPSCAPLVQIESSLRKRRRRRRRRRS
ncbi:hypothetical protein SO802_006127 [Lithocarpus litseifolius]|uniref:Uncharacterized protein n=1 Tax=Lithocarpus litseifolius TaxID=425828 RepID=A0AAW2DND2_9ROSI